MKQIMELHQWNFRIKSLAFETEVTLPHTWNTADRTEVQLYRGEAEYNTVADLPDLRNKRVFLYFGAAYHTANIYVNEHLAGLHTGSGYTPFAFDITAHLRPGKNQLRVTVDNHSEEEMLPHRTDYDWADDGGLIRGVRLAVCDLTDLLDLQADYEIQSISDGLCSGVLNLTIDAPPQSVQIKVTDFRTQETVLSASGIAGDTITLPFQNLKLWEPQSPALYVIQVGTATDRISRRIGFRTIEVKEAAVLLNGRRSFLKGCEWMPGSHPDFGMAEPLTHSIKCLAQLKNAGCNFTRFHWQQDTSLFDWCDENGLLVQEEIPYWGYPKEATPLQLKIAKNQADEMVHYHSHHPSIICWGVGNELGGEFPSTIDYVKQMYAYFKSMDHGRLVNYVSNSVSRDTNVDLDDAAMYGDIAMWNEYLGLWQPCDDIEGVIRRTYEKFGDKPSLVSEFGLCEPAFPGGDKRRIEILLERIPIYRSLPNMAGYVWFSLNDYRTHCGESGQGKLKQRIHGSTDLYGNEKPSYHIFSEIR